MTLKNKNGIYVTSKIRHAPTWLSYKEEGWPIISTWLTNIDGTDVGGLRSLWINCISECTSCAVLVAYIEPGDILRGGVAEIGAALGSGVPVFLVGECEELGTLGEHPLVRTFGSLKHAMDAAKNYAASIQVPEFEAA